ncbi:MAG: hypothetical protein HZA48_02685 [Planctomycetes bacterium]|nr:hypothetical protein [Planctomycetota bacterium]
MNRNIVFYLVLALLILSVLESICGTIIFMNRQFASSEVSEIVYEGDSPVIDFFRNADKPLAAAHRIFMYAIILVFAGATVAVVSLRNSVSVNIKGFFALLAVIFAIKIISAFLMDWNASFGTLKPLMIIHCFAMPGAFIVAAVAILIMLKKNIRQ